MARMYVLGKIHLFARPIYMNWPRDLYWLDYPFWPAECTGKTTCNGQTVYTAKVNVLARILVLARKHVLARIYEYMYRPN